MASLLIRNGRLIDPASGRDEVADVAIEGDRIVAIGPRLPAGGADEIIDASDRLVLPGLIDPHVHLREPGQEDRETIAAGTRAAVRGGFTTVVCMPNTDPALDTPEMIDVIHHRAQRDGACRVFPVGAATAGRRGETLAEIRMMARAGAVGFSDDGDAIASAGVMAAALAEVNETGLALMQHCQEPTLTQDASMNAGAIATRLGLVGWPAVAEEVIVERDLRLNRGVGCRYHVQHVSTAGSVDLLRQARRDPAMREIVTGEASPHHLLLTDEACAEYDTAAKMNPPLRTQADVEALREGVADGTITILGTDHAPHTAEAKALDFEAAPFGIVGLETALPLYARALVEPGAIDWPRLVALMTENPARLCGLDRLGLGRLAEGGPADVTVIDPDAAWTIDAATFATKGRSTPFNGWPVRGRAIATVVRGVLAYSG